MDFVGTVASHPNAKCIENVPSVDLPAGRKKSIAIYWHFYGVNRPPPPSRKCLRYFEGIECCDRVKATHMAWKRQGSECQSVLIYKFPGRQFEKASDQMGMK